MKRRDFLISGASLAGAGIPLIGSAASKPCPPSTLSVSGGTATASSCALGGRGLPLQYLVFDGADEVANSDGPSNASYEKKAVLRWSNVGGDWADANQTPQGSVPYASVSISSAGLKTFNVTPLVSQWLGGQPNKGFYLRGTAGDWAAYFSGRLNASIAQRPALTIVTSTGTFTPPCLSGAYWARGSEVNTYNGTDQFLVARAQHDAIVQFDLSSVTGTVKSATLNLYCQEFKAGATSTVGLFEANHTPYRLGGDRSLPGFAQAYPNDVGIGSHPSVLWTCQDWDAINGYGGWDTYGPTTHGHSFGREPDGTNYIRVQIPAGQLDGINLRKRLMVGNPLTSPPVTELYARYRIFFEDSWRSTVDSTKAPGFDTRMGYWVNNAAGGYWQSIGGNGGAVASGRKVPWSKSPTGYAYDGHAVRGHFGNVSVTPDNPYNETIETGTYLYHIDQPGLYGENLRWGHTVFERNRWHNVESYMKINTVSGPYDSLGNGEANYDGILRYWVDGQLTFERTNLRWRRHPEMGIDSWWMVVYHGGVKPPLANMHCRWANFVMAKNYIGPVSGA